MVIGLGACCGRGAVPPPLCLCAAVAAAAAAAAGEKYLCFSPPNYNIMHSAAIVNVVAAAAAGPGRGILHLSIIGL